MMATSYQWAADGDGPKLTSRAVLPDEVPSPTEGSTWAAGRATANMTLLMTLSARAILETKFILRG